MVCFSVSENTALKTTTSQLTPMED